MVVRVLCAGDIHIGRHASKVRDMFRSADAWSAIVELAIHEGVHLLALSGDVIDEDNKSYEALGPMEHGLARLHDAGIETVAVTGNHDHDVLTRLADITGTGRFHLLGRGGQWERYTFVPDGIPLLHIDGWSFPREHVTEAPLHSYAARENDGVPVMGLLHGDVGVPLSRYAPISLDDLWAQAVEFWLLGHIHQPRAFRQGDGPIRALYPGSPWALDPGERGMHGVWMAEIHGNGHVVVWQKPMSPVRYDSATVDLTDVDEEIGFQQELMHALEILGQAAIEKHGADYLKVVSARLHCVGRSPAHRRIPGWVAQAQRDLGPIVIDSVAVELDTITAEVHPEIDLRQRAGGTDPVAEIAKILLAMENPDPEPTSDYTGLIQRTLEDMQTIHGLSGYAALKSRKGAETGPTEQDARTTLSLCAWETMSMLLAQKDEA